MNTFYAKETLPEGYAEAEKIDLVKNKKQMLLVNGLSVVLAVLVLALGILIQPEGAGVIFQPQEILTQSVIPCLVICIGTLAYIAGHEAAHGILMWHCSHVKPRFGFSFAYAYAGSDCYFAKTAYLVIALAPLVFWGVVFTVANILVPAEWFWVVWVFQITNISGAAGDLYVFAKILRMPEHVLVQDTGTDMTVFL